MAGPPAASGYERLQDHLARLGARPAGGSWLIEALEKSGLRGRGGAGFPAGLKWAAVAQASRGNAVVVVNASEGEPLSTKDRTLVTFRPHVVLDGAALAAETLGASDVVIYFSRGSDEPERSVREALKERARAGIAGPEVKLMRTSHRYVAGESSAVVNRVSGGPSKPKFMIARTAEKGVDDRPTLIQNAETIAHVAMIGRYGAEWFRKLGTAQSPGTMLMTVCGNVRRPGVYEADPAASLGGLIAAAGGPATQPAGALLGGYFGSWVGPQALETLPLDAERLKAQGASLGCGIVAVLPQRGCAIVEATRIITYLAWESAGQCGPCVNGLAALSEAMERIAASKPDEGDLERVHRWIDMVRGRGACHHPDGAVGQLETALKVFGGHLQQVHMSGRPCDGLAVRGFPRPPAVGAGWR